MTPEEHAAHRLLTLRAMSPPVDVEALAARYARVEHVDLPVSGDAVVIRAARDAERPLILLNKSRTNAARKRFTLAHEIGHLVLGWHFGAFACHVSESGNPYITGDYGVAEAEANRFASELLMPTPWVRNHIEGSGTVEAICAGLKEKADVSHEAARIKLLAHLPPGYACMVEGGPGTRPRVDCSEGTPLNFYLDYRDRLEASTIIAALDRHAVDGCTIPRSQRPIRWWKLDCRREVPESDDRRPSTEILRDFLEILHDEPAVVIAKERRINGLLSTANVRAPSRDVESLFGALKLRFDQRDLRTDPFLADVIGHPVFETFLTIKARELSTGRNKSRTRKARPER